MNTTSLGDIAGRVTQQTWNADRLTAGTVCLPTGALTQIRRKIPQNHPKWRDASDSDIAVIVRILLEESLGIHVWSLWKTPVVWNLFWTQAASAHARIQQHASGKMGYIKAATIIKYLMFSQGATISAAHAVHIGKFPKPAIGQAVVINNTMICDDEIQGSENVSAFEDIWRRRDEVQPWTNRMGVQWKTVEMKFVTEQQEPLLLLADYVAGIAHSMMSDADTLIAGEKSRGVVAAFHNLLKNSSAYTERMEDFSLRYEDLFPTTTEFLTGDL